MAISTKVDLTTNAVFHRNFDGLDFTWSTSSKISRLSSNRVLWWRKAKRKSKVNPSFESFQQIYNYSDSQSTYFDLSMTPLSYLSNTINYSSSTSTIRPTTINYKLIRHSLNNLPWNKKIGSGYIKDDYIYKSRNFSDPLFMGSLYERDILKRGFRDEIFNYGKVCQRCGCIIIPNSSSLCSSCAHDLISRSYKEKIYNKLNIEI